jgi:hypothetical protein
MIAGQAVDGQAGGREGVPKSAGAGLILYQVAGRENRIRRIGACHRMLYDRGKTRGGAHAAHAALGRRMQMRIGDMQQPEDAFSHGEKNKAGEFRL